MTHITPLVRTSYLDGPSPCLKIKSRFILHSRLLSYTPGIEKFEDLFEAKVPLRWSS